MIAPDGPLLLELGNRVRTTSAVHCDDTCQPYHRMYPWVRLLGVRGSVANDHDALLGTIEAQARTGTRRVLVSGCADTGVLAYVIAGFQRAGLEADVVVVDRCETPLEANRWFAAQHGWSVETWRGDIRDFVGQDFDLVVAHNFLGHFIEADQRTTVARVWHDALVPGGAVYAVTGRRSATDTPDATPRVARAEQFLAALRAPYAAMSDVPGMIAWSELEQVVRDRHRARPARGGGGRQGDDVLGPLVEAGFEIVSVEEAAITSDPVGGAPRRQERVFARRPAATSGPTS